MVCGCFATFLRQQLAWEAMALVNEIKRQLQVVALTSFLPRIAQPEVIPTLTEAALKLPGLQLSQQKLCSCYTAHQVPGQGTLMRHTIELDTTELDDIPVVGELAVSFKI